ncbi:hypothetical protein HK405_012740, partial [Cladochytrium tenue]
MPSTVAKAAPLPLPAVAGSVTTAVRAPTHALHPPFSPAVASLRVLRLVLLALAGVAVYCAVRGRLSVVLAPASPGSPLFAWYGSNGNGGPNSCQQVDPLVPTFNANLSLDRLDTPEYLAAAIE